MGELLLVGNAASVELSVDVLDLLSNVGIVAVGLAGVDHFFEQLLELLLGLSVDAVPGALLHHRSEQSAGFLVGLAHFGQLVSDGSGVDQGVLAGFTVQLDAGGSAVSVVLSPSLLQSGVVALGVAGPALVGVGVGLAGNHLLQGQQDVVELALAVLEGAAAIRDRLIDAGLRVKMDSSDNSMGWKCAEYEMKGVPLRVECGPRDLENGQCVIVRRTDREKVFVKLAELETAIAQQLEVVQQQMFDKAKKNLDEHIFEAHSLEEAKALQDEHGGYIKTMWCGELDCELKMKEVAGMSSRCIPFAQENLGETCACCGRPAQKMVYWGIAY